MRSPSSTAGTALRSTGVSGCASRGLTDRESVPVTGRKELINRLRAGRCGWCEHRAPVEVHQVRSLADLVTPGQPQPGWAHLMPCAGRPWWSAPLPPGHPRGAASRGTHGIVAGEPRAGKLARVVRTGCRWKRTCLRQAPRQRPTGVQAPRKNLAVKPGWTRRYHIPPETARTVAALLALRDQVIAPILAGVHSPRRGRKPAHWTAIDRDYENLRIGMQAPFTISASQHQSLHRQQFVDRRNASF
jgi:hypothetical protein